MPRSKLWIFASLLLLAMLGGCEQEGPMEEAGESVDETVEESGEALRGD